MWGNVCDCYSMLFCALWNSWEYFFGCLFGIESEGFHLVLGVFRETHCFHELGRGSSAAGFHSDKYCNWRSSWKWIKRQWDGRDFFQWTLRERVPQRQPQNRVSWSIMLHTTASMSRDDIFHSRSILPVSSGVLWLFCPCSCHWLHNLTGRCHIKSCWDCTLDMN